jgi:hypothetical protein
MFWFNKLHLGIATRCYLQNIACPNDFSCMGTELKSKYARLEAKVLLGCTAVFL